MDSNCVICLVHIAQDGFCTMEPCGHTFHSSCIQTWLVHKTECPICRAQVSSCHHGDATCHDPSVLVDIIEHQKQMIQSMKKEVQVTEDNSLALQMRIEMLVQHSQNHDQQLQMRQLIANHIFHFDSIVDEGDQM
jgi:hypothetical protein